MTFAQLLVVFVGWAFLFYLNNRTLRRSELSRLKESLTKELENLFDWLGETAKEKEIEEEDEKELKALELEDELAIKISLVEIRFRQLNDYAKFLLFNPAVLSGIRKIDTEILLKGRKLPQEIHIKQYDILEDIEQSYHQHYFKKSFFASIWLNHKDDIAGIIAGLSIVILVFVVAEVVFG